MEALTTSPSLLPSTHIPNSLILHALFSKPNSPNLHYPKPTPSKSKLYSASPVSPNHPPLNHAPLLSPDTTKFDWHAHWYPIMPECDLDKTVPLGKKVLGIDVVVWWDKKQSAWKVFDDMCPHRLAPLSEGRIDPWGRLQCVYHGWCFDGSGSCKLIPQAPDDDGNRVHTNKRACVAAYPTIVHHGIVWFWPSSDPRYRDVFEKEKPPFVAELDDPEFTKAFGVRDLPYGYEVLMENLMDPAHVPYSHYGLVPSWPPKEKRDKEGGRPLEFTVTGLGVYGYDAKVEYGQSKFAAPCVLSIPAYVAAGAKKQPRRTTFIFMCIPVSPGNSRLIWAFPRNFNRWIEKIVPRWCEHLRHNMVLDSDLHLLHVEERRIKEAGGNTRWQQSCFVPTKSDALVVGFRRWLNQYGGGEVDWGGKYAASADLPPTPPREQLMDRYWTHVVNCTSCNAAYKRMKALETLLQILSVGFIAVAAATKEGMVLAGSRTRITIMATLCFAGSRWLARFVYTNLRYHDYNHAVPPTTPFYLINRLVGVAL